MPVDALASKGIKKCGIDSIGNTTYISFRYEFGFLLNNIQGMMWYVKTLFMILKTIQHVKS